MSYVLLCIFLKAQNGIPVFFIGGGLNITIKWHKLQGRNLVVTLIFPKTIGLQFLMNHLRPIS